MNAICGGMGSASGSEAPGNGIVLRSFSKEVYYKRFCDSIADYLPDPGLWFRYILSLCPPNSDSYSTNTPESKQE